MLCIKQQHLEIFSQAAKEILRFLALSKIETANSVDMTNEEKQNSAEFLQICVATCLSCSKISIWQFCYKFTAERECKRLLKIRKHLAKL